jgi:hypothetical protein
MSSNELSQRAAVGSRPPRGDRSAGPPAAAAETANDQLGLQDELNAQEGVDGWDIFDEARARLAEEAEAA